MTQPRYVPQGRVWFLCRRCTQRQFLLRPSKQANQAFLYCLAVAAKKTGVQVLWTVAMSNHHHTGIYDPTDHIIAFTREFHRLLAKHHNAMLGRWENFWASESPTNILLHDTHDILAKLIYSLANPASAQLVEHAHHWPGSISLPQQLGTSRTIHRPKTYFREDGSMPDAIELQFHLPPGFEDTSVADFQSLVANKLAAKEEQLALQRQQQNRKVLGRRNVLRQNPHQSPQSVEPRGVSPTGVRFLVKTFKNSKNCPQHSRVVVDSLKLAFTTERAWSGSSAMISRSVPDRGLFSDQILQEIENLPPTVEPDGR